MWESSYDPKKYEQEIYRKWENSDIFKVDNKSRKKTFVVTMAPPNITGSLHMGHALENIMVDVLMRFKKMMGYETLFLPGTDHAGIATQNVVEKELKKQGLNRHMLGREEFIKRVWQWKEQYGDIILKQFKLLGLSIDLSRKRFTLDENYQKAVAAAFIHYYNKGWIYRAERVINFCPRCKSSISDLEIDYKPTKTFLYYIKYPFANAQSQILNLKSQNYIVVATTRPETMLGDTAVAVNPKDKRYKNLIGLTVKLPIQNREIPIIEDLAVDQEFGTGAVKVTPAHDMTDWEISQRHNLPLIKVINEDGKMTDEAGPLFAGLSVKETRVKVLEILERDGLLLKNEEYEHNLALCDRCKTPIEPLPSLQWFLSTKELNKLAIKAVKNKKVLVEPNKWQKPFIKWLEKNKDWCISRQIWWGHSLPVWFCQNQTGISNDKFPRLPSASPQTNGGQVISKQTQNSKLKTQNNFIVSTEKPRKCPVCGACNMKQSEDVLDTWFSSALWPFATLGWPIACAQNKKLKIKNKKYCIPNKGTDLARFYPTSLITSAPEILHLWISRMVFSGMEFMGKPPFKKIFIHSVVLTKDGKRMSKSLGTGIDPLDLIGKYGSDALRFGLMYQSMGGQAIHFDEAHILTGKKFGNKMWNASRFVAGQIGNYKLQITNYKLPKPKAETKAQKDILQKLEKTKKQVIKEMENLKFGQPLHLIYDFFWHDFCDIYLEQSKKENSEQTPVILSYVLTESLKLVYSFMPHIVETIFQKLTYSEEIQSEKLKLD